MIINGTNLRNLGTGYSAAFQVGFDGVATQYQRIATVVSSTTARNEYGWLGQVPKIREWIGDRVLKQLVAHGYAIRNKPWEDTVEVDRDDIEDDNVGVYTPLMSEMGRAAAVFPDELTFGLLKAGFSTPCYDGQYFFDTDHPVIDETGATISVSNSGGGAGTPWFLLDVSRALKPLIYQNRRAFQFVSMDKPDDESVFMRKKFRYGTDGRSNGGFGFWQMAFGSKQTLDAASYKAARAAMRGMRGDQGRPLGIRPQLLVVPPALEEAGLELLNAERDAAGATNVWKGTAELMVVEWLA